MMIERFAVDGKEAIKRRCGGGNVSVAFSRYF